MRFRLRTVWLEIAAGFHLLFAAVVIYVPRGEIVLAGPPVFSRSLGAASMLVAACAVFLLHPLQSRRKLRPWLCASAGAVAALGAAWFLRSGQYAVAALQIGYAIWLLGAAFVPWFDQRLAAVDEVRAGGFNILAGAVLVAVGVLGFQRGDPAWHAPLASAWSIAAAVAMIAVELRLTVRRRRAACIAGAMAFLYHGVAAFSAGDVGSAGAMGVVFALLVVSVTGDERLPEAADDLSGLTPRQREIYLHERAGEAILWLMAAFSAVFINFIRFIDVGLYFGAMLALACVTQFSYRLRPAVAVSERRYFATLASVMAISIAVIVATGGVLGPFIYVAYFAIFAGTVVIRPGWSLAIAAVYAAYVLSELAWHVAVGHERWIDVDVARHLFVATMLLLTGLYTFWTGCRRIKSEDALLAANRRLAEALRDAVRDRERAERQTQDLKGLNENLVEMRSALMNVLEDVEESKRQIEVERRREVASFNALAEGVVAAGKDGRIFLCNPAAARILSMPAETVIGQPIERVLRLFQEEGAVLQTRAFEEAYAGRTMAFGERLRLSRADGSHVPVSGSVAPYLDEENRTTGVVAAFRDVTVEREIDRQKSDFISIASHQLRTPLSALRWFLDLLLAGDAGSLKPTQKEYLGDMSVSVARMIKLVGDLLNISRIESGRTKPNPERIETRAFVESVAREFMPLVREQEVVFSSSVAKDATSFFADPSMARQAIANVISNAVKYTPSGGSVAFDISVEGDETVFTVKDTGVGIPKGQQYRIYDKFFRGENVVAQETVGSGLGLYVVKTIADLSGGRVWFESVEKKGTTFHLSFPNGPKALPDRAVGGTLSA